MALVQKDPVVNAVAVITVVRPVTAVLATTVR